MIFTVILLFILTADSMAFSDSSRLLIIAHRGVSSQAPENTLSAFHKVVASGANVVELDIRQTKDSALVILHDGTVDRTSNGHGDVEDFILAELRRLDAGSWFDTSFSHERIPTLKEALDAIDSSLTIIIEIKEDNNRYPGIEEGVLWTIRQQRIESRVIVKSFDRSVLKRFRSMAPDIPLLYVFVFTIPFFDVTIDHGVSLGSVYDLDVEYLQLHRILATRSFVEKAHRKGKKVVVWAVDDVEGMKDILELGVDGIETDFPNELSLLMKNRP